MAIKTSKGYKCGYCGKLYALPNDANVCKENHQLIYVALTKEDLNRLVNFIFSKEDRLLTEELIGRLQSYLKGSFAIDLVEEKK